ncbi:hypothetical protein [Salinispora pacifica]|uniref:hypothetical protein n=1 Tax=Salinispora pacifica TaxID=351187 RepID=UPI000370A611|nr:hypothetical protein [Salinispora pacifica]
MKTVTLTDDQYACLLRAVKVALRQAKQMVFDAERDLIWADHRGDESSARFFYNMLALSTDLRREYTNLTEVVELADM